MRACKSFKRQSASDASALNLLTTPSGALLINQGKTKGYQAAVWMLYQTPLSNLRNQASQIYDQHSGACESGLVTSASLLALGAC